MGPLGLFLGNFFKRIPAGGIPRYFPPPPPPPPPPSPRPLRRGGGGGGGRGGGGVRRGGGGANAQVVNLVENCKNEIGIQNPTTGGIGAAAPPGNRRGLFFAGARMHAICTRGCKRAFAPAGANGMHPSASKEKASAVPRGGAAPIPPVVKF